MCTESQLNQIVEPMVECYTSVYGNDIVAIVRGPRLASGG